MDLTKKVQITIPEDVKEKLWLTSDLCTDLWNGALEERTYKRSYSRNVYEQKKDLPIIKALIPEYKVPSSQVIQNVIFSLDDAISSFFATNAKGDKLAQMPRFKSKKYFFTQEYSQYKTSFVVENNVLKLSYGKGPNDWLVIPLPEEVKLLSNFKTAKIYKDKTKDKYYVSFSYNYKEKPYLVNKKSVYFDPGSKTALTGVNTSGKFFEYSIADLRKKNMQTYLRLDKLKSKLKNKTKGSTRYCYINKKISKGFQKINTRTKMTLASVANRIIEDNANANQFKIGKWTTPQTVSKTENKIKDKRINRAVQNNNPLSKLIGVLDYKAKMVGKEVSKFDERGSTSTCVMCGTKHKKSLSPDIRVFKCINEKCQFEYPRDNHSCLNFIKAYEPALWQSLVGKIPTRTKKIQFNVFSCKIQSNTVHFKMHNNLLL
jgi:putative transposase